MAPSALTIDADRYVPLIADALREDVLKNATDAVLKRLEELPALKTAGIISKAGGLEDAETKTFADWLLAVKRKDARRLTAVYHTVKGGSWLDRDSGDGIKAPLAEASGTTGGYLVPTQFVASILQIAAEMSVVRDLAYKQPMSSRTTQIPFLDQTQTPTSGVGSAFLGGVVAYWTGEGGNLTETEPTFRLMELVAHKLAGFTVSSTEELEDSAIGLQQLLTTLFAKAIAWTEDYAFLRGNGVGKPLGISNSPSAISITRTTASSFVLADAAKMLSRMLPTSSIDKLRWVMHPFVLPQLVTLQVGSATGANWITNLQDGLGQRLLGIPIKFSEKMAPLGTAFDVLLADFSYYVIGDRRALELASSEHYKFANDQMTWRFTYRVDGQPWLNNPVTLADGVSQCSPFVYLT